jgi:sirohydrochlorin ferrochelatase
VDLAFAATGSPAVHEAVHKARLRGDRRIVVASYLLADGLFQERLRGSGADLVTPPLGTHPGLAQLVANRFRDAVPPVRTAKEPCRQGSPTAAALDLW